MKGRFQPTTVGNMMRCDDGGYVCHEDYAAQKHRADVLAATIRELRDVVTHAGETKADFIARVRKILGAAPDSRVAHNAADKPTGAACRDRSA